MWEFVQSYGAAICAIAAGVMSVIAMIVKKKGGNSGVFDAVKWALKALPGLITFSETVNGDLDGAAKKAFVLEQIKNNFAIAGIVVDASVWEEISDTIDKIVAATKRMHTGAEKGGVTNDNSRNDVGTVTGLRA